VSAHYGLIQRSAVLRIPQDNSASLLAYSAQCTAGHSCMTTTIIICSSASCVRWLVCTCTTQCCLHILLTQTHLCM